MNKNLKNLGISIALMLIGGAVFGCSEKAETETPATSTKVVQPANAQAGAVQSEAPLNPKANRPK